MPHELSHFDEHGASRMIDVSQKSITRRSARASAMVTMSTATLSLVHNQKLAKGNVLEIARLAGIMAAKRTADLIPLCHPLPLDSVTVDFAFPDEAENSRQNSGIVHIEATVSSTSKTGVEMEALTAVSIAALTIYDMCKSAERGMRIEHVRLEEKSGGRSGDWKASSE
ncbi:MAG TPA: cyclic pyranopterin monophosphate synthase MoaC [Pirellulales bacterium]|jgi:cyclic pyranopterin phosphate synthase|nr:cyclic pyranopterin monophosphate synthase MoaC [Pirellulales bacterium]